MQSSGLSSDDCQTSVIMRHKEPKNKEPSTPDLLNDSANVKTTVEKNRPRSCVNPTTIGYDICPNNSRIEIESNRRWSGVHLGSKLMQAFDRLVFDDSDDYTDSLENNKPPTAKPSSNEVKVTRRCFVWTLSECFALRCFVAVSVVINLPAVLVPTSLTASNIYFVCLLLFYPHVSSCSMVVLLHLCRHVVRKLSRLMFSYIIYSYIVI